MRIDPPPKEVDRRALVAARDDGIEDLKITLVAKRLNVPPNRVYQILGGKRSITADTAMRLGKFFGSGPEEGGPRTQKDQTAQTPKDKISGANVGDDLIIFLVQQYEKGKDILL